MQTLRNGYTTGACAAAGVWAALRFLHGEDYTQAQFAALDGTPLTIPVRAVRETADGICAEVIKDAGDDPDITDGVSVFTTVRLTGAAGVRYHAGTGIGTVTKAGLAVPVGEPAINPGPRALIAQVVQAELRGLAAGVDVTIAIPAGVALAQQTLNPVLGIVGGISVIGTTGVVRPMSEEGFKNSLVPQIDVALAAGEETLIFVPGKIGERIARRWGLPAQALVQTSNFIGFLLQAAAERGARHVLLFGHPGKLVKVAAGVFHTHNRVADARLETLAAYGAANGLTQKQVQAVLAANTTEDALKILQAAGLQEQVCRVIAARASARAERYVFGKMQVGTVLVALQGQLLGMDEHAAAWLREWGVTADDAAAFMAGHGIPGNGAASDTAAGHATATDIAAGQGAREHGA